MLEQNVSYRAPEIPPVGGEGVLVVGFDISLFRGLDVFDGLGGLFVVIERGQEARFHADVQLLHLRGIQAEILPAERTHAHEFHLSFEDVDEHREFIDPTTAEFVTPVIDTIVTRELAALLQAFVLQDVGLEVFRIGVHRAELVHADHLPFIPDSVQFDEGAKGGIIVPDGFAELLAQDKEFSFVKTLVNDFETSPVHSSQQFHTAVTPVLPLRYPHIKPAGPTHPGENPVPEIMEEIEHLSRESGTGALNYLPLQTRCSGMAQKVSSIHHVLVRFVQESIQVTDSGKAHLVDNQPRMMALKRIQRIAVVGIHDVSTRVEFVAVLVHPGSCFRQTHLLRGSVNLLQIHIANQLLLQLSAILHAPLRIVLREARTIILKVDPGFRTLEQFHLQAFTDDVADHVYLLGCQVGVHGQ